jgi:hypothetical protein
MTAVPILALLAALLAGWLQPVGAQSGKQLKVVFEVRADSRLSRG